MKISLRAIEPTDADFMYDIENDVEAWKYGDTIAPLSRKMLRDYALNYDADPFRSGQLRLVITENSTGSPIGLIDLYEISQRNSRAFAGIYIRKEFRRKGYAFDAIETICRYASDSLHLHQLAAKISDDNMPSLQLFSRSGFLQTATLPDWIQTSSGTFIQLHILTRIL